MENLSLSNIRLDRSAYMGGFILDCEEAEQAFRAKICLNELSNEEICEQTNCPIYEQKQRWEQHQSALAKGERRGMMQLVHRIKKYEKSISNNASEKITEEIIEKKPKKYG